MPEEPKETDRAGELVAAAIGELVEFWGFRRIMGRIWTSLYLGEEPLSAKDLAAQLKVSVSLVSTTLNELLAWGVVRRAPRPGSRADLYEAETQLWKMISKVLKERETFRLEAAIERLAAARAELGATTGKGPDAARRRTLAARIERLERLSALVRQLIDVLLEEGSLDVTMVRDISLSDDATE